MVTMTRSGRRKLAAPMDQFPRNARAAGRVAARAGAAVERAEAKRRLTKRMRRKRMKTMCRTMGLSDIDNFMSHPFCFETRRMLTRMTAMTWTQMMMKRKIRCKVWGTASFGSWALGELIVLDRLILFWLTACQAFAWLIVRSAVENTTGFHCSSIRGWSMPSHVQ